MAKQGFLAWKLQVHANRSATLSAGDGSKRVLMTCMVPATDFPMAQVSTWLVEGVLLLPGEY